MLTVEIKRLLKTRSTWWLIGIAFVFCLFFALWAIRLSVYYSYNESGQHQTVRGTAAYELNKEKYYILKGEVTPELLAQAVEVKHRINEQYGDDYSVPPVISSEVLGPYSPVYTWISRAFTDENGTRFTPDDLSPEQARSFYTERLLTLERQLEKKYEQQPQVVKYATSKTESDESFYYSYGIGSTRSFEHLGMCAFLVTLICIVITAPIFASDYANGADDILRCTKFGRKRLAFTKLGSALIVSLGTYVLCIGAFLAVVYLAFGFDDMTSAELLNIVWTPKPLTAMSCMGLILLLSLLAFLSMSCFTLFLSARLSSPVSVLAGSIAVALIPTVLLLLSADGNVLNWLRFCLPSGGVLPSGAMLNELGSLRFLWIGSFATWSPYVMLAAAAVQTPIWFGLAVRAYSKHEAA